VDTDKDHAGWATDDTRFLIDNIDYLREKRYLANHYLGYIKNMELALDVVESATYPTGKHIIGKKPYYRERRYPVSSRQAEALHSQLGFIPHSYRADPRAYTADARRQSEYRWIVRTYATGRRKATLVSGEDRLAIIESEEGSFDSRAKISVTRVYVTRVDMETKKKERVLQQLPKDIVRK